MSLRWDGILSLCSRLFIFLLLQSAFALWCVPVVAERLRCADLPIAFECEKPEEIKCVCETARSAVIFLKSIGLETTDVITVRLVERFPPHQMHNMIGCYNATSREIDLLTYAKTVELAQSNESIPAGGVSEDVWCSYAAHEIAHAVSSRYIGAESNNHTVGEYIAAVTQLSVLTSESREEILKAYQNIEPYESIAEMSIFYFLFAPNEFAVKCYLHFISQENPKEFIDRLVREGVWSWDGY